MRLHSLTLVGACLIATSCNEAVAPEAPAVVPVMPMVPVAPDLIRSQETVAGVSVALAGIPSLVAPGDTVRFVATARNATRERIQIGMHCGPSMDVSLATPNGQRRSALTDLIGTNGAFTCALTPQHFVQPDSTQVTRIAWVAPNVPGEYVAVAGLRRVDGLGNLSEPIRFRVR